MKKDIQYSGTEDPANNLLPSPEVTASVYTPPAPPSRAAREAKIVFVIICTDSSGSELSDSVVAVAGTEHHAIAYIDLQPEHFQKTYDIEEYTVIQ